MLLFKQESYNNLFLLEYDTKFLIYTTYLKVIFISQKTIRNHSNILILFIQTLRVIMLLIHDIVGLDTNLEEWKQLCGKAWENEYDYLQSDRFGKMRQGRYANRICNRNTSRESTPEKNPF